MPLTTDTTRVAPVLEAIRNQYSRLYPGASHDYLFDVFALAEGLFTGRSPDFQANDLKYHDFRHTLQVSCAFADVIEARQGAVDEVPVTARQFELGLSAALLHDSGYLKLRSDVQGTGAKYTYCHVLRSCAMAASLLPPLGLQLDELEIVVGSIRCTGPTVAGTRLKFNAKDDQILACAVATADFLGQMAAEDYPDELEYLYAEFKESDDFIDLPNHQRVFKSVDELINGTPIFWEKVVKPKLDREFMSIYRHLTAADGSHPYIDAIEYNLKVVARRMLQAVG